LGFTFKENCPDIRNTKVIDIYRELKTYHLDVDVCDPWADPAEVHHEYGISSFRQLPETSYDAVILAVAHQDFAALDLKSIVKAQAIVYDVKSVLPKHTVDGRL
jgi:UDP-N-acetyl-D-galactosamine dehydrogenase